jgi:hypothetical protein
MRRLIPARDHRVERLQARVDQLRQRIEELESEVRENKRLNRRLTELTDIVQELLLPAAQRDEKRLAELLEGYREKLP